MARATPSKETLAKMVKRLGIPDIQRHIFLCCDQTKANCSARDASLESWAYLKKRLVELDLVREGGIYRTKANCLQVCTQGPVAVVYPEGTWYTYVDETDIDEIVESHLADGKPVDRLKI